MKKLLLLLVMAFPYLAPCYAQKFYVTVDGLGYPDAKEKAVITGKNRMLNSAKLSLVPNIGTVQSFTVSYLPARGEYAGPTNTKGAAMTEEEKKWIERSGSKDKFFFEDITMRLNDGSLAHADPFMVLIQ